MPILNAVLTGVLVLFACVFVFRLIVGTLKAVSASKRQLKLPLRQKTRLADRFERADQLALDEMDEM